MASNSKVAHAWAHQLSSPTRGSNYYFSGDTIYSFGSHFECGKLVTRKGVTVALITTNRWSGYTSRHINMARVAVRGLFPVFHVPLYSSAESSQKQTPAAWFKSYVHRVAQRQLEAGRSRKYRAEILVRMRELADEANRFAEFYGLKGRITLPADLDKAIDEAQAEAVKARALRDAKLMRDAEEALSKWRNHEKDSIPYAYKLDTAFLRLSSDRTEVETSMGASVPVEHAERAYHIFLRYMSRHEAYQRNGHTIHVGHFEVDSMDTTGRLKIGCHKIEWPEVERLAKLAGWSNEPAPDEVAA